ncbi:MAG: helix-turn-helix domain-containing protein [Rhodocyclaceae bacterium]
MSSATKAPITPRTYSGEELLQLRQEMGLNQNQFWKRFGITQSGGSRYESGRAVPRSVRMLLTLGTASEEAAMAMLAALRSPADPAERAYALLSPARSAPLELGACPVLVANQAIVLKAGEHELRLDADGALTMDGRPIVYATANRRQA